MNADISALLESRRSDEPHDDARKVYDRLLSGGALLDASKCYEAYADLADIYYKKGERYQAISVLEEFLEHFLDRSDLFLANKITNKIEFLGGKTVLKSKPLKLEIALLDQCNLRCTMCLQTTYGEHEITEERYQEILALIPYLEVINWIGGEVFLSPYFEPLFDAASRHPRLKQNLVTNGLRIDARWAEKLARNKTSLLVSIDGFTAPTYERIRKGAKFGELLAAMTHLHQAFAAQPFAADNPDRLAINFVLMRQNLGEADQIVDFAHRYGFHAVQISSLWPFEPESEYRAQNVEFDPESARLFMDTLKPRILRAGAEKNVRVRHMPAFTRPGQDPRKDAAKHPVDKTFLTCAYPWGSFFADAKGSAKPFCLCGTFSAGNVYRQSIAEIWNDEGMRRYRALADVNDNDELLCRKCDMANYRFQMKLLDPLW
jgi:MoaA/NifB/PqqE/SkfB family radical SAM enzyme